MGFQHLPKVRRSELAAKAARSRRSEALQEAWKNADRLRNDYDNGNGKPASRIAKDNNINVRSVFRIVRGK